MAEGDKRGTLELKNMVEILEGFANDALERLPSLALALVVFFVFYLISKLVDRLVVSLSSKITQDRSLQRLFATIASVLVIVIGIFVAAAIIFPGLQAGDLVSVLGLSSVAIGFAFKDIFQNFLAGILILTQRPFEIGDQIARGDIEGTVETINIRSTLIRTYDGQRIIVPNSELFTNAVTVRTAFEKRRTTFQAGIAYKEDINEAREVIRRATVACEGVLDDPAPQIYVVAHDDSSVNFDVRYWSNPSKADVVATLDRVATAIKYALDEAGIEIPFPYRTVEFFDKTERGDNSASDRRGTRTNPPA